VNNRLPKDWSPPDMPKSWSRGEHWVARVAIENGRDAYDEWVDHCKTDYVCRLCPQAQWESALAGAIIRSISSTEKSPRESPVTATENLRGAKQAPKTKSPADINATKACTGAQIAHNLLGTKRPRVQRKVLQKGNTQLRSMTILILRSDEHFPSLNKD